VTFDPSLYMDEPYEQVVGRKGFWGTVCYTEISVPAALFLADIRAVTALKSNVNLLGDSTSRGSLLGAILRAAHGMESGWPNELVDGLRESKEIQASLEQFVERVFV
jgi:ADP-ribosylglycohydrolase